MAVPESIQKSVLFIGIRERGIFRPRATGFLCLWHEDGFRFQYLVTAEHIISGLLTKNFNIWASTNMKNGDVAEFKLPHDIFCYHPDESQRTDVAVCRLPDQMRADDTGEMVQMDVRANAINGPRNTALMPEDAEALQVGVGDQIFMIGLFRNHYGREQNVPIVRAGNIACMRNEPVFTDYAGYIDAYLVEAHSISGLSGSPVFLANHPRVLRSPNDPEKFIHGFHGDRPALYLMGLMHGHFDIKKLNEDTVVDDERDTTEGINTGIGVVVPVEKIVETIRDHPDLANQRKEVIENEK